MPHELTELERLDRIEDAVREIALYVSPAGMNNRLLSERATSAIIEEAGRRRDAEAKDRHRESLTAALEQLDAEDADGA